MTTLASVLAFAALDLALFRSSGFLEPVSLALVLVALGLAIAGACVRWRRPAQPPVGAVCVWLLGILTGAEIAALLVTRPGIYLRPDASLAAFRAGVLIAGAVVLSYGWRQMPWPRARFPAILAVYVLLGAWTIDASPRPYIDVWHFQQRATELLLNGQNPYAAEYPNIYGHTAFYGEKVLSDRGVRSFAYPPLSLLMALPGRLVGDVRWSLLAAVAGATAFAVATGRRLGLPAGHPAELGVIALLFHPRGFLLIEQGWNEPFLAFGASACGWALVAGRGPMLWLALAAVLSAKQYGILWAPSLLASGRLLWRDAAGAAAAASLLVIPFLLWDPAAFWRGVFELQLSQPFRADALSMLAWVATATGRELPAAVGFFAALIVAWLVVGRALPTPGNTALGGAAVFLAFFAFNKQAFLNYYWFVESLLALAIIASAGDLWARDPSRRRVRAAMPEGGEQA